MGRAADGGLISGSRRPGWMDWGLPFWGTDGCGAGVDDELHTQYSKSVLKWVQLRDIADQLSTIATVTLKMVGIGNTRGT